MKFIDRTGESYLTKEGYQIKIIKCKGSLSCDIEFEGGVIIEDLNYHQIKNGQVKNPYHKSVYGVGYIGIGKYVAHVKRKPTKSYDTWIGMLRRCYSEKSFIRRPTYKDVTVCEEWHNFQTFVKWYEENYIEGFHLDKDLLSKGNKIYSPETCCFISLEDNSKIRWRKEVSNIEDNQDES